MHAAADDAQAALVLLELEFLTMVRHELHSLSGGDGCNGENGDRENVGLVGLRNGQTAELMIMQVTYIRSSGTRNWNYAPVLHTRRYYIRAGTT